MERAQLGAWGELRAQRDLLQNCIDSARMTTDTGVDLVAYANRLSRPFTVQVKTRTPKADGKYLSWGIEPQKLDSADLFAFVGKFPDHDDVWYISQEELYGINRRTGRSWLMPRQSMKVFRIYFSGQPTKAHSHEDVDCFKGDSGLTRFLHSLLKSKVVGAD